jgi:hypothetical protein
MFQFNYHHQFLIMFLKDVNHVSSVVFINTCNHSLATKQTTYLFKHITRLLRTQINNKDKVGTRQGNACKRKINKAY